jgi:hypothetical protein
MPVEIAATPYQIADGSQEVELTHNGQTKRFTAEGLSEYIEALAAVRANLLPPVRLDVPVGRSIPTQLDPNFPPWLTRWLTALRSIFGTLDLGGSASLFRLTSWWCFTKRSVRRSRKPKSPGLSH